MAKIVANMPMLSLPVLAVGAFGAPLSNAGQDDVQPQSTSWTAPDPDLVPLPRTKPLPVQIDFALRPVKLHAVASRRVHAEPGQNKQVLAVLDTMVAVPVTVPTQVSAMSSAQVVAVTFAPSPSPAGQAIQMPQPASLSAAAVSAAQVIPRQMVAPGKPNSNQAIFGTSASNAHKVYFPQIDQSTTGGAAGNLQSFGDSPEQDNRVLKKQGSYLFYDDAPQGGAAKTPKASGDTDAKKVAPAGDKADNQKGQPELTAPVLQKQPLDFEGSLFKSSASSGATPTTAGSNANAVR